jgi:FkbM family methyltransferase
MVERGYKVLCSIVCTVVLALVRRVLRVLTGDARAAFVAGVVESVFADTIPNGVIETFERANGAVLHYSQEGEDILLERLFGDARKGFYVDVGAHHAIRFSNTYALYRKGWRGLNIDATPGSMESFKKFRPDDLNVEIAISSRKKPLIFNVFKEGVLNTFDETLAKSYIENGWELEKTIELVPKTLKEVLDKHLKAGQKIDLMSVDVEGEDLEVLKSNDWERYCPEIIIIEALNTPMTRLDDNPVVTLLKDKGFVQIFKLFNSVILQRVANVSAAS